jgi:hypothetical protein
MVEYFEKHREKVLKMFLDKKEAIDYADYLIEQGFKKGFEQEMEKGRAENKIEIVKAMITKNYSFTAISEVTGVILSEIEKIAKTIC